MAVPLELFVFKSCEQGYMLLRHCDRVAALAPRITASTAIRVKGMSESSVDTTFLKLWVATLQVARSKRQLNFCSQNGANHGLWVLVLAVVPLPVSGLNE